MPPFIEYLIKFSLSLSAVSIFYHLILRQHTFYNWNRWYLLIYSGICFVIPLININNSMPATEWTGSQFVATIPRLNTFTQNQLNMPAGSGESTGWDIWQWITALIILGIIVMLMRLVVSFLSFLSVRKKAKLVSTEQANLFYIQKNITPFSFGNSIFVNPALHTDAELREIILHEYVHIKQVHTLDVLWSELLCVVNWFNPFAWLMRYAIRQNLEYIADRKVLENGIDAREYQYLLLKVVGLPEFRIANQFNFSSLKQRIVMMNKAKTAKIHLVRFLFVFPLILVLLVVFRNEISSIATAQEKKQYYFFHEKMPTPSRKVQYCAGLIMDGASGKPLSGILLKLSVNNRFEKNVVTDRDGFYYAEIPYPKNERENRVYAISYKSGSQNDFALGSTYVIDKTGHGTFHIMYTTSKENAQTRTDRYVVNQAEFFSNPEQTEGKRGIKNYLMGKMESVSGEHQLKIDFLAAHKFPKDVITKFRNAYFDRDKELIGYENTIEFYLDGKKATHLQVNDAFKGYPYVLSSSNEHKVRDKHRMYSRISYLTFALYKAAPPALLLRGNVEWKNVKDFDPAILDNEPFFLDGFRQVYGVGSNLRPMKKEIKRIALFKGNLARYYDGKLRKIWWVETRPETEVYERPALEADASEKLSFVQ